MAKVSITKPVMVMMYGFPGSGKSYFGRQLAGLIGGAHIHSERIRHELFESPRYDEPENEIIENIANYMAQEFFDAGISVIYDLDMSKLARRREARDFARKHKALPLLVWLQIDADSAFARLKQRDRRKADDKYAKDYTKETFDKVASGMQNLQSTEDYMVISGKHNFNTQRNAAVKRLYDMGLIDASSLSSSVAMPGLVNLVPRNSGRVDMSRRNIVIR